MVLHAQVFSVERSAHLKNLLKKEELIINEVSKSLQIEGKQKFDEYILVSPGSDYGYAMWRDIDELENGIVLDKVIVPRNKILNLIHHIHFSFVINSRVHLPCQHLWKNAYTIKKINFECEKRYCVLYTDVSAGRTDKKFLSELKEEKNISLILVMVNTMARRSKIVGNRFRYFDYIFSFDKCDCDKYGFIYHPTNYSALLLTKNNIKNDAFYVGVSKGRQAILEEIFSKLEQAGAKCSFYISGVKNKRIKGIHYNEWLPYAEVLKQISDTNCIVEVMEGNQAGVTLRAMEAICYNKRLLTNNPSIKNSPFYNTGYIQVFNNLSDIDTDFVKDRSEVDYKYNNEFSPIHLLEHINQVVR